MGGEVQSVSWSLLGLFLVPCRGMERDLGGGFSEQEKRVAGGRLASHSERS